jgi:signal transduction histidine kinase/ligand-binding sensor domain-containing protein
LWRELLERSATLAGLLLVWLPCAFALNPALDVGQYAHTSWKNQEGFAKGDILDIAQSPDGYLWLATEFGLLRFDGFRAIPWQAPHGQSLPSNNIRKLFAAPDGTLWIGTTNGLASWKNDKLTHYPELGGFFISRPIQDHEGTIWTTARGVSFSKLCQIRDGKAKCEGERVLGVGAFAVHEDRKGNLWVAGSGGAGIWKWKPGPPKFYPVPSGPLFYQVPARSVGIQDLAEDENGAILIPSADGIARLANDHVEMMYPYPRQMRGLGFGRLLRDRDGGLWASVTGFGIVHVHNGRIDTFSRPDGLTGEDYLSLSEDREGNIWVGTRNGLDRFREFPVVTYTVNQGLSGRPVGTVLAAKDGSIWFDTIDGLDRLVDGRITVYGRRPMGSVRNPVVNENRVPDRRGSLFQDSRGRIWISSQSGIGYLDHGRYTSSKVPGGYASSFTEDTDGNIWIANQRLGLFCVSSSNKVQQYPSATFRHNEDDAAATLAPYSPGGIWIGLYKGGLVWFREGHVAASYTTADGLGKGRINDLRVDKAGVLWAATENGLSLVKNGRVDTLTSRDGLPCDAMHWTIQDDSEAVWLLTNCGIVRLMRSEIFSRKPGNTIHATLFDSSEGVKLANLTVIPSPQVAKSLDGRLWFGNVDGLGMIDPAHLPFNKLSPPVHIEQITADRKAYAAEAKLRLPALSRDLQIDYTALSLVAPEKIRFRYKLEGHDRDWQDVGNRRQAFFNDLPPGNYRFRVIAANNGGVWNEAGAFLDFSITPAYYQTAWFRGAVIAGFLGLLWSLYQLRQRQVTQQFNMRVEERVGERTRIARDLHDTLLQSLAGVSLQLDGIAKHAVNNPEKMPSMIARIREQVDSAFREAREKVWNLRSPELQAFGLEASLRQLTERIGAATTAGCNLAVSGQPRLLEPDVEEELLRIAQEAANNASRHAEPNEIRIALDYGSNSLILAISDDGRGFDFAAGLRKTGHWGLKNMQERATLVGGTCNITTAAGQGTRIEIRVPLTPAWSMRNTRAKHAHSSSGG